MVARIHSLRSGLDPQRVHENVSGGRHAWSGVCLPTDPARPGDPQIASSGRRACELSKEFQNYEMTGSLTRGMPLDGDLSSCGHHGLYSFSQAQ